jgi:hypothetical protein
MIKCNIKILLCRFEVLLYLFIKIVNIGTQYANFIKNALYFFFVLFQKSTKSKLF